MDKMACDVDTRKHFRIVSHALSVGIIMSSLGVTISILVLVNHFMNKIIFPFTAALDPPYFGIICTVLLVLFITMAFSLGKIRAKACKDMDLPLI